MPPGSYTELGPTLHPGEEIDPVVWVDDPFADPDVQQRIGRFIAHCAMARSRPREPNLHEKSGR